MSGWVELRNPQRYRANVNKFTIVFTFVNMEKGEKHDKMSGYHNWARKKSAFAAHTLEHPNNAPTLKLPYHIKRIYHYSIMTFLHCETPYKD